MAKTRAGSADQPQPDQQKLTARQAMRLAALTSLDREAITGLTTVEIAEKFKWQIDPTLLLFRRICGRVVKKDPITGIEYPVPFATVHVQDTDCGLVGYFPPGWPWSWFFPLFCHRETLATVITDKCGSFCAWIPRWEIDWILRWRKHRICFPDIFVRPSIKDVLPRPIPEPFPPRPFPPIPEPGPDPAPFARLSRLSASSIEALAGVAGRRLADRLAELEAARQFGGPAADAELDQMLGARLFDAELAPPLPKEFQALAGGGADVAATRAGRPEDVARATVAMHLGLSERDLKDFDLQRYIGPFFRCFDIYLPEWQLILDVPDITFRVTQDVDGDGTEETIYSEGFFDVRWNAGAIPDVTLVASSIARETHACDTPVVPCGNAPAILFAGLMPLTNPAYFDAGTGYALRPNRPIPPAGPRPAARTPFLRTLQIYGCVNVPGAHFYRVLLSTDNGGTFAAITGLQWNIYPIPPGPPVLVSADPQGWYPVLPNPEAFHPARMLIEWPTPALGKHVLKVEIGDAAKAVIQTSPNVAIHVDNTLPTIVFSTLRWKFSSEPDSAFALPGRDLLTTCPTIHRGASPQSVDVQMEVAISANHLRDCQIYAKSCDNDDLATLSSPTPKTAHWHESVVDNAVILSARYHVPASELEGAYRFGARANSRAMNPAGSDNGHLADWFYDPVYAYRQPEIAVAIVNA